VQVVARSDETMWPAIATTDAGGHFLVQGVGAGIPYRLRTEGAPAHVDVAYPDTIASPFATFDTITLANDEQRGGLGLALPRGGWVSGRIHDAYTDAPVAGAIVRIVRDGGEWGASTTADANGRYATSAVPAGTYNVVVQLPSATYLWPATPCADPWSCNATAANAIAIDDTTEHANHDLALPGTDVILRSGFE
jgi:hypothetical protein